jgi:hypothetical protein
MHEWRIGLLVTHMVRFVAESTRQFPDQLIHLAGVSMAGQSPDGVFAHPERMTRTP